MDIFGITFKFKIKYGVSGLSAWNSPFSDLQNIKAVPLIQGNSF